MSSTTETSHLKRRPISDSTTASSRVSPRSTRHSPKKHDSGQKFSDEDQVDDSFDDDEDDDSVKVDDTDEREHVQRLYPDLSVFGTKTEYAEQASSVKTGAKIKPTRSKYVKSTGSADVPTATEYSLLKQGPCLTLILVVICVALWYYSSFVAKPAKSAPTHVTEIVNTLKKEFVNQPSLSFRIIKKALDNVIEVKNVSEPLAPAVLLLMSTKGAKDVTTSFANHLAELVASGEGNYQTIYGNQLQAEDPDKAKKEIDDKIKDAPKRNEHIVVLIQDLDVIPSRAAMMLHGYCDHENAPFKNAVFIMTIDADAVLSNCDSRQFDEAAELHLTRMWSDLSKDKLGGLLSRITVSVAAIYHKTKPTYCK